MGKLIKEEPINKSLQKRKPTKKGLNRVESTSQEIEYLNQLGYSAFAKEDSVREMINTNKYVVIDNTSYRSTGGTNTPHNENENKLKDMAEFIKVKVEKQYGSKEDTTRENSNREGTYGTAEYKPLLHDASVQ